jgi:hypothetical protein
MFESRKGRSDLPKVVKLPNMTAEVARLSSVDNVRYQTATGNDSNDLLQLLVITGR